MDVDALDQAARWAAIESDDVQLVEPVVVGVPDVGKRTAVRRPLWPRPPVLHDGHCALA
jgi:hypothetical protein